MTNEQWKMLKPLLLLRTIRHLRWKQLAYRPLRMAQYRFYQAFPQSTSRWTDATAVQKAPVASGIIRSVLEDYFFVRPMEDFDRQLQDLIDHKFTFLNRRLEIDPIDWNRRYESHLWNYQLHYFNYAVPAARALVERGDEGAMRACRELIVSWMEGARIGKSDGWDPYPLSLRAVNWIYAYSLIAGHYDDRRFLERWRASIYRQLDFLSSHLEYQHLANHLLKNVKALLIGGLFFKNEEWLNKGESLLWREFEEQVLEDGGHYERAPMYHAQVLTDFLECYALVRACDRVPKHGTIESRLRAMAGFLDAMSYTDGTLALFNDSANTEECGPETILESSARIAGAHECCHMLSFPNSGYHIWISRDGREKIIVDAGPPSAGYNSAHAHCDLLSYELWLDGRPFVVDSGVHGYGGDRFREYSRSTRAHNTVMFDDREQSEIWGTFRMARRARVGAVEVNGDERSWCFRGEYRPYYDSQLVHKRHIERDADGRWHFTDRLVSGAAERATSFIHLHPEVQVEAGDGLRVGCNLGQMQVLIEPFGAAGLKVIKGSEAPIQGWYFPEFGIAQRSATICIEYNVRSGEAFGYKIIGR
jgi:uncharacterized heparinase superfamily protein